MRRSGYGLLILASCLIAADSVDASTGFWRTGEGTASFSLHPDHLRDLGLTVVQERTTSARFEARELALEPPVYSFRTAPGFELEFTTSDIGFEGFVDDAWSVPLVGGLVFRAENPATGALLPPAFLYDFEVGLVDRGFEFLEIRTKDPALVNPLDVRSTGVHFDSAHKELIIPLGDVVVTEEWATRLGRPELTDRWIGTFDLRFPVYLSRGEATTQNVPNKEGEGGAVLDVLLGQLYGLTSQGHVGTYPNGVAGLAAATTSCNNGNVNVPWNAPMAETHPFIGIALFRQKDGIIEQLGMNWLKHGWYALSNNQCDLGCVGGGGSYLAVGCSDTYSASNNGSRYYLGPRSEINPLTAAWSACGSYFDATPVDCSRDYFGGGHDAVEHKVEVSDEDLNNAGAVYYYEGCYYVANDDSTHNNIGWRQCTMSWDGGGWDFQTVGGGLTPSPGPVVRLMGTSQQKTVAPDDGDAIVAYKAIDLGGGMWRYEYALYNRHSDRGLHSFSIPVGSANVSNVGFRDIDKDSGNDWSSDVSGGYVTWSTDDFATDPGAPALYHQMLYNFRFDADDGPDAASAEAGLFKPGVGTSVLFDVDAPSPGPTSAVGLDATGLSVEVAGRNPFSDNASIRFSVPQKGSARLSVMDVSGRVVQTIVEGEVPGGTSTVRWNGRDANGSPVASGVYFFRLETEAGSKTVKGTFLR